MNNPGLMRIGLGSFMDTLASIKSTNASDDYPSWAVELTTLMTPWIPIQHRYLTVLTCLEDLESRPRHKEISTPEQELVLTILEGILTTEESLIGLNVIDVLTTLIAQIAAQLAARPNTKTDVVQKLVNCIIGLAGHVYYTDQIRDMCSEIMEWSRPLFQALVPTSGIETPATESDDDVLDVPTAAIWSLCVLKGVMAKGGGSVGLEQVWMGTEGGLIGRDGQVRLTYVDALVTHLQCEDTGEPEEVCCFDQGANFRMPKRSENS
jgi:hypothetical protein